jgi:carboxypeptidase C (cathepsin A)
VVAGSKAGLARSASNFTFLQVYAAGHMVPMDQPARALSMLETFLNAGSFY